MEKTTQNYKQKSLTGSKGTKTNKKATINKKLFDKCLKATGAAAILFAGIESYEAISEALDNRQMVVDETNNIWNNIIEPNKYVINPDVNTPREETHYYYKNIAESFKELGNDEIIGVYTAIDSIGVNETNRVLKELGYESVDDYYEKHNLKDKKDMKKQIIEQLQAKKEYDKFYSSNETYNTNSNETYTENESGYYESNNQSKGGL